MGGGEDPNIVFCGRGPGELSLVFDCEFLSLWVGGDGKLAKSTDGISNLCLI